MQQFKAFVAWGILSDEGGNASIWCLSHNTFMGKSENDQVSMNQHERTIMQKDSTDIGKQELMEICENKRASDSLSSILEQPLPVEIDTAVHIIHLNEV